ncbi:hypothetical protein N0V87_004773 [Didymella glomerata]|uniref:Uncharacterized protein n=1 Tax=Didymella glomerata TaxID=749621 RepID=A0A9W9C044_9PLEO|nr:hypothetical protein N0V87_004773 [Didymella glomerata]
MTKRRFDLQIENERSTITIGKLQKEKTKVEIIDALEKQKAALDLMVDTLEAEAETDRLHRLRVATHSRALIAVRADCYRKRDRLPEDEAKAKAETEPDEIFNKHLEKRPSIRSRLATTV